MSESWLGDTKLLPHVFPRNQELEKLVDEVLAGKHTPESFQMRFMTTAGFARPLYYLTLVTAFFRQYGRQIFVVPQEMGEMLSHTSVNDVTFTALKFPYPCFYVALKDCDRRIWGGPSGWHNVEGVYVSVTEGGVHFYFWGAENAQSKGPGDDAFYWLSFSPKDLENKMSLEALIRSIVMNPMLEEKEDLDVHIIDSSSAPPEVTLEHRESIIHVVRVIVNLLLYMDSSSPELERDPSVEENLLLRGELQKKIGQVKNPNKKSVRAMKKQLDLLHPDNIVWIGRSVQASSSSHASESLSRSHHWVRGHWWPSQAYIDEKITSSQKTVDYLTDRVEDSRTRIASGGKEELLRETPLFLELQKSLLQAQTSLKEAEGLSSSKRRWVRPYERNRGQEPTQRAYMFAEKA